MNCKICGKEIFYKDSDMCEECSEEVNDLEKEYKKLRKRQYRLIVLTIIIPILFAVFIKIITNNSCTNSNQGIRYSPQEIDAANAQWTMFCGRQSGTQIKSMIAKLIANAQSFKDEEIKVVSLDIQTEENSDETSIIYSGEENIDEYIEKLLEVKEKVKAKHTYNVDIENGEHGFINKIIVTW